MMEVSLQRIRKRDGRVVDFDRQKILNAIWRAIEATGGKDPRVADKLADRVVKTLEAMYGSGGVPSVEDVQDIVERVLIEEGLAATAKAYIIYRQDRRRIREDKKKILNKPELDEVDKSYDINSLRVLASRYLLKDAKGNVIESPKGLFQRVALTMAIPDILRDAEVYTKDGGIAPDYAELKKHADSLDSYNMKLEIGSYTLNMWHFETLIRLYKEFARQGHMKISFDGLLKMIEAGKFERCVAQIDRYYESMKSKDFLPNSPTLMNAGTRLGQLSACFVLDIEDDLASIMKAATDAAIIFKSGGGVGLNYSKLRPAGDIVASTSGAASGPVSFMNIIDTVTNVVKQGGRRRGANMGIVEVWHPDIQQFITAKQTPGVLENFNVSVGMWEDFWSLVGKDDNGDYLLRNPRNGEAVGVAKADQLLDLIAFSAWQAAEPGVIFLDYVNKHNVLVPAKGPIRCTNPCGEQPLYPYESCNLGSINLANFVRIRPGGYEFDWARFEEVVRLTTKMLDNIIDSNKYPIREIDEATKDTRKIGLGIMGLADLLFKLGIPYNSQESYELMDHLAEALAYFSADESVNLARERGSFPLIEATDYTKGKLPFPGYEDPDPTKVRYDWNGLRERVKKYGIRNSMTTTVAPTGTISMIANTSNGIEPAFALVFEKHVTVGKFYYVNEVFERVLKSTGIGQEILQKIAENYGSVKGLEEFPAQVQRVFQTAMDIHWSDHLMAQAVWQRWVGASISKTINMPNDSTVDDVKSGYLLARAMQLKGVTVFRDESRKSQVLHITSDKKEKHYVIEPSKYIVNWIRENVKDPYILRHMEKLLRQVEQTVPSSLIRRIEMPLENTPPMPYIAASSKEACPICSTAVIHASGCATCLNCGWSECLAS